MKSTWEKVRCTWNSPFRCSSRCSRLSAYSSRSLSSPIMRSGSSWAPTFCLPAENRAAQRACPWAPSGERISSDKIDAIDLARSRDRGTALNDFPYVPSLTFQATCSDLTRFRKISSTDALAVGASVNISTAKPGPFGSLCHGIVFRGLSGRCNSAPPASVLPRISIGWSRPSLFTGSLITSRRPREINSSTRERSTTGKDQRYSWPGLSDTQSSTGDIPNAVVIDPLPYKLSRRKDKVCSSTRLPDSDRLPHAI
jgi:hypothetical protein